MFEVLSITALSSVSLDCLFAVEFFCHKPSSRVTIYAFGV